MTQTKRHHFIPQFLIRRFTDESGIIHVYRKEVDKIISTDPKNAFLRGRLYSTIEADGTIGDKLEKFFSELEAVIGPFTEKVLGSARSDRAPSVDSVEKENWDGFVQYQIKRVPDFHDGHMTEANMLDRLRESGQKLLDRFPEHSEKIEQLVASFDPKTLLQNVRSDALGRVSERVMDALQQKGLIVIRIDPSLKKKFILGSLPVARLERDGLSDPNGEWWLPIAPDVAIGLAPNKGYVQFERIRDANLIRRINFQIVRTSSSFASSSQTLLRSLAHPR